jgi:hypothetical protein
MKKKPQSPLKNKPLRLPGQSLGEEREELLDNNFMQPMMLASFMIIFAGMEWWRYYMNMKPSPWIFSGAAVLATAYAVIRIWRCIPKLRRLRQAIEGEQAVGQYLERLREDGYQVFHDVVGNGFNIDHVIIGPAGVFTIETKTWSKPDGRSKITFDGEALNVAGQEPDRNPVVQGKAQASWVRTLLAESTSRQFPVRPVILFPGWFIEQPNEAFKDVWILEPKALRAFLGNAPQRMAADEVSQASFHLSQLIRLSQK